jgi:hypothetical protein
MAIDVRKAARFVAVSGSHANLERKSVDILFDGDDGQSYAIEIDPSIIAALLVAIQGEATELQTNLPEMQNHPTQALEVTGMTPSMSADGQLAWRISLRGDIHIDLAFSPDQFRDLDQQMTEIRELLDRRVQ